MQKQTKTEICYHFLFESLSMLLGTFGCFIEQDEVLKNSLQCAYDYLDGIISKEAMGDILEQYVVTVYQD